jgi:hypothetical protein
MTRAGMKPVSTMTTKIDPVDTATGAPARTVETTTKCPYLAALLGEATAREDTVDRENGGKATVPIPRTIRIKLQVKV